MTAEVPDRRTISRYGINAALAAALAVWASALGLVAISLVVARTGGPDDPVAAVEQGIAVLMLVSVGALLVSRLPHHPIGWLLASGGFAIAISVGASGLADLGLNVHPGSVPGALWLAWISQWIWAPELASLFILLPLFYPTGRLPSPRWRGVVLIAGAVAVGGSVGSALSTWAPNPYPVGNPLALQGTSADVVSGFAGTAVTVLVLAGGLLAVASLVVRYRRAATIEPQQLKWFAAVATVTGLAGTVNIAAFAAGGATAPTGTIGVVVAVSNIAVFCGLALLPVAIGIAVLRYRLYDIDLIIRRTAVYVPLTAALAGIYAASIAFLQRLFIAATGNPSDGAVIMSTLVLAATFTPIKNAFQGFVDRHFRDAQDGERRLQLFIDALAGGLARPDPTRTLRGFMVLAVDISGATGGRATLVSGRRERSAGETGSTFREPALVVPVAAGGRQLGRIELAGRRDGCAHGASMTGSLLEAGERVAVAALGLDAAPSSSVGATRPAGSSAVTAID